MSYSWIPMVGRFDQTPDGLIYRGGVQEGDSPAGLVGYAISNVVFAGGSIRAEVEFDSTEYRPACEIILWHDPNSRNMLTVGIGGGGYLYAIRFYDNAALTEAKWTYYASGGSSDNLEVGRRYQMHVELHGSRITLRIDGVLVATTNLTYPLPSSQTGVFAICASDMKIHRYVADAESPQAFIVMEFESEYEELYDEVIKPACHELQVEVHRADETPGPGLIISDIISSIERSKLVIAEVTPSNRNVYFEVGFAHGMRKPVVLLVRKGTTLPFDLSPFRHIFYTDSIAGKRRLEKSLREHIAAVLKSSDIQ